MEGKNLDFRAVERTVKGFSNHRRIQIMALLSGEPELSVAELSKQLKINFRTASDHIRRMAIAGLVVKRSDGTSIRHKLTGKARNILTFLKTIG